jgi:hypothetical protein
MNNTSPAGKSRAVIAYLTFIGMLVAYFMNREEKHAFASWHIKNMFGLLILLFSSLALQKYEVGLYVYWLSVGLWLFSLSMALTNKKIGIPFLGEKFQTWFRFLD